MEQRLRVAGTIKIERRLQNQVARAHPHPFPPEILIDFQTSTTLSSIKAMSPSLSLLVKMFAFEVLVVGILQHPSIVVFRIRRAWMLTFTA